MSKSRYIPNPKTNLIIPIVSKTVYPFVNDKKISSGLDKSSYIVIGRLIRKLEQNKEFKANINFQCSVNSSTAITTSRLKIKYEAKLKGGTVIVSDDIYEGILEKGFNDLFTKELYFANTYDNTEILITAYAINESSITVPNNINLVYLEKKEE